MKLKGLGNRAYNIMFHTHTVSGIVISFALYVIFFAGAFTLFKDEFYQWENPKARVPLVSDIDYDNVFRQIKRKNPYFETDKDLYVAIPSKENPLINIRGREVKKGSEPAYVGFIYNPVSHELQSDTPYTTTVGETLYRLHFLDQLPLLGRYLAGFIALFFFFASLTGLLIHWRNIFSKFYGYSLKGTWRQIWTNAHTVFGLIGLPFQMMYAITGAFYLLTLLILAPAVMVLYGGDQQKLLSVIRPYEGIKFDPKSPETTKNLSISQIISNLKTEHPDYHLTFLNIDNYGREDGVMTTRIVDDRHFTGDGIISVRLRDGKKVVEVIPGNKAYVESVLDGIARLHFAKFGGLLLKTVYFILALFTCFVIISGVLLWKEARNKKNYTEKQKRFHHRVTMWYLSICFGLFPATAILFNAELLVSSESSKHTFWVNTTFFISWLMLIILGLICKTETKMTKVFLVLTGIFSLIIPLTNGLKTGDWIWVALFKSNYFVAGTDIFWLITGISTLFLSLLVKNKSTVVSRKVVEEIA
ncbi:PepSY-associated TM helix domain-containing protein [Dyadobacter subterraneus]|uniref:PepSY domain-containing protein n=2 Tax=Dyadobacter subterraneus TaxID=2773304 RepID=A0ABR9WD92_9BACT|nr:PepSY domain-containing protein [Dyadobacter subterraneus]